MRFRSSDISGCVTGFAVLLLLGSCSVKENRVECPCYLDVTLLGQGASAVVPDGNAWCGIWTTDQEPVEEHIVTWMDRRDTTLECRVSPKGLARVVVSSAAPSGRTICASEGSQMPPLYVASREVDCFGDEAALAIDRMDKKFCRVTLVLGRESLEFADRLSVEVEAPYNGIVLPSMKASEGRLKFSSAFDDEGRVTFSIPPQGGPGLRLVLRFEGGSPVGFDLYSLMAENLYDWDAWSMKDFRAEVGLNSVSHAFVIGDWNVVDMDDTEF